MGGVNDMLWTKEALFFKDIPKGYRENEKIMFAGVDFSGIQGFIYQNDNMESLNEITRRSEYIQRLTVKMNEELIEILEGYSYIPITVSSGKIQAIIKNNKRARSVLRAYLEKMQGIVFVENQAKIQIFYGITYAWIRSRNCEGYDSALFTLMNVIERNKYQSANLYELDPEHSGDDRYSICSVLPLRECENSVNLDSFKLAAVKMDFDNLGNLFSNLKEADVKADVSATIIEIIEKAVTGIENIHLIYAGGDDIFFICPFTYILETIQIAYLNIRRRIYEEDSLADYRKDFGISCGVCVFHRDVPMIHYMDNAEKELLKSKGKGKNQITVENLSFGWEEWQELNEIMSRCSHIINSKKREDMQSFKFKHFLQVLSENACEFKEREYIKRLLERDQ